VSNRPNIARKQTRTTHAQRREEMDAGLSLVVNGTKYTVRIGDIHGILASQLRRETGYSFRGLMMAAAKDPDIDIVAAIMWLSRRIDGEHMLAFEDVAEGLDYDADVELAEADGAPEDDHPEA
jgi:hypothetical protein